MKIIEPKYNETKKVLGTNAGLLLLKSAIIVSRQAQQLQPNEGKD